MEQQYAKRMKNIKASEIREILKVTQNPEIISFAGGLPAPELFPIEEINNVSSQVLMEDGMVALQYTTTEGYAPLRKWIAERMNQTLNTSFDEDNILITHGSQQALDLTGKVFLDEGDIVLCESPTYLAAITAFKAYGCEFIEVPTDDNGMIIEELEKILNITKNIKVIYTIPNFQNPTGKTWSLERRKRIAELANQYQLVLMEDNPYGELRFAGEFLPAIQSFDIKGNILSTGTFSKTFCPGFRIGWIAGDKDIIKKYVLVKQGVDLQCNTFVQMVISKYLENYNIDTHIQKIRDSYKNRRNVLVEQMGELFPKEVLFTRPDGGLFAWVTLPEGMNARTILEECIEEKVAFVPGDSFFPNGGHLNTLRLNYSNMPEERIIQGIERMAKVINKHMKKGA
ncbi:MAG: PLP-dependent aminotransferase family protein [Coprobacillaceae bacterium]